MNKFLLILFFLSAFSGRSLSQTPIIDSWIINPGTVMAKYYVVNPGGTTATLTSTTELADISDICYSSDSVWIKTTGMPSVFGPWSNPGEPADQNFTFRFPRNPVQATTEVKVPIVFTVGVLINGAPIFGNGDAKSYKSSTAANANNGDGLWNGNAYYSEGHTLDSTFAGHVNPNKTYHSHATPYKLYKDYATTVHSPLVGFAFDGYPVYGPYGYSTATNSGSSIQRIRSSYKLRNITTRTSTNPAGPNVSATFPLGMYIEDYEYVANLGDLDDHNGRYCVTPEYPGGTYAYFVTIESDGTPAFPYYFGTYYYGKPDQGNLTPTSTVSMTGCLALGVKEEAKSNFEISPNPVQSALHLEVKGANGNQNFEITICNYLGEVVYKKTDFSVLDIDMSHLMPGLYTITFYNTDSTIIETHKFIKQ